MTVPQTFRPDDITESHLTLKYILMFEPMICFARGIVKRWASKFGVSGCQFGKSSSKIFFFAFFAITKKRYMSHAHVKYTLDRCPHILRKDVFDYIT